MAGVALWQYFAIVLFVAGKECMGKSGRGSDPTEEEVSFPVEHLWRDREGHTDEG